MEKRLSQSGWLYWQVHPINPKNIRKETPLQYQVEETLNPDMPMGVEVNRSYGHYKIERHIDKEGNRTGMFYITAANLPPSLTDALFTDQTEAIKAIQNYLNQQKEITNV
jgi:hypothetical protein